VTDGTLHVRGLSKSYHGVTALDGVDLDVVKGEIFALLGPNGAGKTTLVEILEGYRRRTAGEVRVLGADPFDPPHGWRARIGIVLQDTGEKPELTVREWLGHFARFYPTPRDVDATIEAVGLTDSADVRIPQLSGGQRRRVDVALGIIGGPELLFLDEPTTGFAPEARRKFWGLIRTLADDGTTILLTTHYLDEAAALADRVGVLIRGRVTAVDAPDALGGRPSGVVEVSWVGPDGPRSVETATPSRLVAELTEKFGGDVPQLRVARPSLEDVYLAMIGDEG
jgi:ABC-2 type transport system ATP-binding protein